MEGKLLFYHPITLTSPLHCQEQKVLFEYPFKVNFCFNISETKCMLKKFTSILLWEKSLTGGYGTCGWQNKVLLSFKEKPPSLKKIVISFFEILYNSSISKCVLKLFAMDVCSKILVRLGFSSSTEWHGRCWVVSFFRDIICSVPGSLLS